MVFFFWGKLCNFNFIPYFTDNKSYEIIVGFSEMTLESVLLICWMGQELTAGKPGSLVQESR